MRVTQKQLSEAATNALRRLDGDLRNVEQPKRIDILREYAVWFAKCEGLDPIGEVHRRLMRSGKAFQAFTESERPAVEAGLLRLLEAGKVVPPRKPESNGHAINAHSVETPAIEDADWPDPCPLPDALLPVDPFDFDLMPDRLRPWVADVAERMQAPADFVAVSVMAAVGSMIGRKVAIRPKANDDWQVFANQWAFLIGRPGVLKSPAMQEALRELKRLAAVAEEAFKKAQIAQQVDAKVAKMIAEANFKKASELLRKDRKANVSHLLDSEEEAPEPTLKRFIVNDTNVASLGVLLQQNPNGLLVFRDELVSLLDNLDREENASERDFYLTAWSGDSSYTFDRIARGLHLHIEGLCLSLLGSTQPGRIAGYLANAIRGGRGDDGMIQRFGLLVWPDIPASWTNVDRWPDKTARDAAYKVFTDLDVLDWRAIGAKRDRGQSGDEEGVPYLRFGLDAYDRFVQWRTDLEHRLCSGELHPALESHLAKYRKLVPGLALICHLVDGGTGAVGVAAIERAIAWAKYLESHARRAYGSGTAPAVATAKAILARIQSGQLKDGFGSRDVWRPGWSKLTDRDAVMSGLNMLVDYDWLRLRKVETGGRPALAHDINPKILKI
jgi:putative DNA primase/helicase